MLLQSVTQRAVHLLPNHWVVAPLTARARRAGEDYLLAIAGEKFQGEAEPPT